MNTEFLLQIGFALLVLAFAVAGIGLSIWLGRRKTIGACSCDFDPEKERRKAQGRHSCAPSDCACAPAAKTPAEHASHECCGGRGCHGS